MTMLLLEIIPIADGGAFLYQTGRPDRPGGCQHLLDQRSLACTRMAGKRHISNLGCLMRHLSPPYGFPG